jgi:hypothetical protein
MKSRIVFLVFTLFFHSCIKYGVLKGDVGKIKFVNLTSERIGVYFSNLLPDTTMNSLADCGCSTILPNSECTLYSRYGWKNDIKKFCPSGMIMFVVLNRDTVDKYGIDDVKLNGRVAKRFKLSIDSLENINWTLMYH